MEPVDDDKGKEEADGQQLDPVQQMLQSLVNGCVCAPACCFVLRALFLRIVRAVAGGALVTASTRTDTPSPGGTGGVDQAYVRSLPSHALSAAPVPSAGWRPWAPRGWPAWTKSALFALPLVSSEKRWQHRAHVPGDGGGPERGAAAAGTFAVLGALPR